MIIDKINLSCTDNIYAGIDRELYNNYTISHELKTPIYCDNYQRFMIGINKIIFPKNVYSRSKVSSLQLKVNEAISDLEPSNIDGAVVYTFNQPSHEDNMYDKPVIYYKMKSKAISKLVFKLTTPFTFENNNKRLGYIALFDVKQTTDTFPIIIQYSILIVSSIPELNMEYPIPLCIDHLQSKKIYTSNNINNFRTELIKSVDTSLHTGRPYLQLNGLSLPGNINFTEMLKKVRVYFICRFPHPAQDNEDDNFKHHRDKVKDVETLIDDYNLDEPDCNYELRQDIDESRFIINMPFYRSWQTVNIGSTEQLKNQLKKVLRHFPMTTVLSHRKLNITNKAVNCNVYLSFSHKSLFSAFGINAIPGGKHAGYINLKRGRVYKAAREANIFKIAPNAAYVYANCINRIQVNAGYRTLLGVIEMKSLYIKLEKEFPFLWKYIYMYLHNNNSFKSRINTDTLKNIQISIETENGEPFPLQETSYLEKCGVHLLFTNKA